MKELRIAVLLGGTSREREISIRSGKRVAESLRKQKYQVVEIDPKECDFISALQQARAEVAFIMLHGKPGEDGTVQSRLEEHGIPFTGSGSKASAICIDKVATKRVLIEAGIPTPRFFSLDGTNPKLPPDVRFPVIVKPIDEGSSFGVIVVDREEELPKVASETLKNFENGFVEQFIEGKEVTVGILGTGDGAIALPILELRPKHRFYDYEAKYTPGLTEFILPAELPADVYRCTQEVALAAYRATSCRGFGRVDFMVSADGTPYVIEINTIPGMTDLSDLPACAAFAGISFDSLVLRVLQGTWE